MSLTPTSKQQDTLIACFEEVKRALSKDRLEDVNSADVINIGSLAKQTLSRGTNEVDIMVCFSSSITGENFQGYLLMIKVNTSSLHVFTFFTVFWSRKP